MDTFIQQTINGLVLGSMYSLIALGYTMVYGILNLINFAHGDVLTVGALTALSTILFLQAMFPGMPGWVLMLAGLLAAIPVCVVLSLVIERVAYRPLRNAPRLAPLITAIGVSIVIQTVAMLVWGRTYMTFPQLIPTMPMNFGEATITLTKLIVIALSGADDDRPDAAREPHPARARDAGDRREPARGRPDGREPELRDRDDLRHRRRAGRARRRDAGRDLQRRALLHGVPAGPEGVHGGRARRHRQHSRCHARRTAARPDRGARRRLHRRS